MSLLRPILYSRPVNALMRTLVSPVKGQIPEKWHFPVNGVVRVRLEDDLSIRLRVNPTSFQGKQFFWYGMKGFEPAVHRVLRRLMAETYVFMDIGANLGLYSLLAGTYQSSCRILSFEPLPAAYSLLLRNLALNRMKDVDTFPVALSDKNGSATFHGPFNPKFGYVSAHLGGTGSLDPGANQTNRQAFTVPTARLDDLLTSYDGPPVDLIKMDTEGTEHHVLDGGLETIRNQRPLILCEVLPNRIEAELDLRLKKLEYRAIALLPGGLKPINSLEFGRASVNDYLLCPAERSEEVVERFR